MKIQEIISEAIVTLSVNKLRTSLATLGIVIGIGSVIALMSVGLASQKSVTNQIESLGSNLLTVSPSSQSQSGVQSANSQESLTKADADAISNSQSITTVARVSPEYQSRGQVTTSSANSNNQIIGVTPNYALVRKVNMETGVFISETDVSSIAKVAVLGPTAASNLFGDASAAIGQTIRINGQGLKIIGVTKSKGGTGFQNQDTIVFVPLSTAQKILFGTNYLTSISVEAKSADVMTAAQNEVGYLLLNRHKKDDPTQADFTIFSQNDVLGAANQITGTITALLSGIAGISLVVGGIGIMNIMLVTVTERTREIGLRKALGARKKTIVTQFLVESVILTSVGGVIGMVIGVGLSLLLSKVMNLPQTISIPAVLLAIGVSGLVGIVFGWYPAQKAANMRPIEALRYE